MLQFISTIIFYSLFAALVVLLWMIWRNSLRIQEAQQVLNAVTLKNAESVQKTADAVYLLAARLDKSP